MLIWFKSSAGDKPCWCWLNSLATEGLKLVGRTHRLIYDLGLLLVISHRKHLMVSSLLRGDANSTWGSVGALIGRQEPFELNLLDHPADYYDFHIYTSASSLFSMYHQFDGTSRKGPRDFVSEYAVTGKDAVGFFLDGVNPLGLVLTTKFGVGQWY
ncbi:hypothetical protein Bca52824_041630 [Brassica carinata]|uniref:Uncharacterized protein n=1 Tax=Brassica carinata TaxID=52824 RepID=A0A8X7UYZ9_BRACI|nr:hypothetical protein Bca52824_041630 [Brassica carinata]